MQPRIGEVRASYGQTTQIASDETQALSSKGAERCPDSWVESLRLLGRVTQAQLCSSDQPPALTGLKKSQRKRQSHLGREVVYREPILTWKTFLKTLLLKGWNPWPPVPAWWSFYYLLEVTNDICTARRPTVWSLSLSLSRLLHLSTVLPLSSASFCLGKHHLQLIITTSWFIFCK